jgi:hypothetical protein
MSRARASLIVAVAVVVVLALFSFYDRPGKSAIQQVTLTNYSWPLGQPLTVYVYNGTPSTIVLNGSSITYDGGPARDVGYGAYACIDSYYMLISGGTCYITLDEEAQPGTNHVVGIDVDTGVHLSLEVTPTD